MRRAKRFIHFKSLHGGLAGLEQPFLGGNHLSGDAPAVGLGQICVSLRVSRLQFDRTAEIQDRFFETLGIYLRRVVAAAHISFVGLGVRALDAGQASLFLRGQCDPDLTRNRPRHSVL